MRKPSTIVWEDASAPLSENGWVHDPAYLPVPLTIHSRGYLVKETKSYVVLALSSGPHHAVSGLLAIPKSAIRKRNSHD